MMERYLCIHGHFYQPPRENPWLEMIEVQDSAYPYHDWNERITAECYAPNSVARILTGDGRIDRLVNNYSKISFNFGPTLLSWLEHKAPDVYRAIQEADRESQKNFSGHGSALAQAYNHMILPLADRQDKATQVAWGLRDFERRFGRKAEGMWLPETAVDLETLEVLAEFGLRFTILAPYQAGRVRKVGEEAWQDVGGGKIDPSRAYLQKLPSGRSIALFFYDGPVARAIAFEGLLAKGEVLAGRLLSGFSDTRDWPQLVHVATDGESYGHHHSHGDMGLAYALHHVEEKKLARLTNYGEFLEKHPPTHEVEIVEKTAWSCAHGIERWRSDCGCNSGRAGWNQAWRGPLRAALDWLRDTLKPAYEKLAGEVFRDPWGARNEYIDVLLERTPEVQDEFLERHACRNLSAEDRTLALKLLEMQRNALLMYTSCGWFFDEISGLEGTQVLLYAGRALQLGQELFGTQVLVAPATSAIARSVAPIPSSAASGGEGQGEGGQNPSKKPDVLAQMLTPSPPPLSREGRGEKETPSPPTPLPQGERGESAQGDGVARGSGVDGDGRAGKALEEIFLELLAKAPSNLPEYQNGRRVFERFVRPAVVTLDTLAGFYAVRSLFEEFAPDAPLFCYRAERQAFEALPAGKTKFASGRVRIVAEPTREAATLVFAALYLGDHNVNAGVRTWREDADHDSALKACAEAFARADFPQVLRLMVEHFGESTYSLQSLFRDEQRRILKQVLRTPLSEAEAAYRRLYEQHLPLMRFLAHLGSPMPRAFQTAAAFLFNTDLRWLLEDDDPNFEHIRAVLSEVATWKVPLDAAGLGYRFSQTLERIADRCRQNPTDLGVLEKLDQSIALARSLPFSVNLWTVQNIYFELRNAAFATMQERGITGEESAHRWLETFVALGDKLQIHVAELHQRVEQVKQTPTVAELVREAFSRSRIPGSTYRFQFQHAFRFSAAKELVPYLAELGITDCYASPILEARAGSTHCYDLCNPGRLNPDVGGEQEFEEFSATLKQHGLGLVIDTVPNHMGIGDPRNLWWNDVLENGVSSIYASFFDIDWHPTNPNLDNKLLLPVLEDQYGQVLEQGKIQLAYEEGSFGLHYYALRLPVDPGTYALVLERLLPPLVEKWGEENERVRELRSILTALSYLPARTELPREKIAEKNREKEVVKRRIAALVSADAELKTALDAVIQEFNGKGGAPHSFDLLDRLVESQAYRLAYWRVATEEINYRRFFDINELAAIRMELPEVFEASHQVLLALLADGKATGLRIDHPDGLLDPTEYFRQLQQRYLEAWVRRRLPTERMPVHLREEIAAEYARLAEQLPKPHAHWPLYVVAEKILSEDEPLPTNWEVYGTTGYDFLNLVNGLFIDAAQRAAFDRIYSQYIGTTIDFQELVHSAKTMILQVSMASEINSLSHQLDRISEGNRRYRDFTLNSLALAVREIIACLRVYRAYITSPEVALRDRLFIEEAVAEAKRRNPRTAAPIFDFIRDSLLLKNLNDFRDEDRPRLVAWSMKFQQLCGPIMAKGVEDTAFYIYNRLVSLNEVGGRPAQFGIEPAVFHQQNVDRQERWPHSLLTLSTHDTKRSEDVRARLNVLSEMPERWQEALLRWSELNASKKAAAGKQLAPDRNDEYLLYQTILGIWPREPFTIETFASFRERIVRYMGKATREAKVHTSWINPNQDYDNALREFILRLLPDAADDPFLKDLSAFARPLVFFGYLNSLAQTLLKMTCPGVPDFYQGTELWDFSLVDPDNRRPVDYELRRKHLTELRKRIGEPGDDLSPLTKELLDNLPDGRVKLFVIERVLNYRRGHQQLFDEGRYTPLEIQGAWQEHVCAFLRQASDAQIVIVVPRLLYRLSGGNERIPLGSETWSDTRISLPGGKATDAYRNIFTGERVKPADEALSLAQVFRSFPVALLERESAPAVESASEVSPAGSTKS